MSFPPFIFIFYLTLFYRVQIHEYVSGVPGAAYSKYHSRESALIAFAAARRRGAVRRVVAAHPPPVEVVEIMDTDSEDDE